VGKRGNSTGNQDTRTTQVSNHILPFTIWTTIVATRKDMRDGGAVPPRHTPAAFRPPCKPRPCCADDPGGEPAQACSIVCNPTMGDTGIPVQPVTPPSEGRPQRRPRRRRGVAAAGAFRSATPCGAAPYLHCGLERDGGGRDTGAYNEAQEALQPSRTV
jgi:hypothetical protein